VADTAAAALPVVPGGASTVIRAGRLADTASDAVKAAGAAGSAAQAVGRVGGAADAAKALPGNPLGGKALGEIGGPKLGSVGGPGAGKRATPGQRAETLKENDGKCVFCGAPATEADHAYPKSRGGNNTTGPDGNLQPTCTPCNRGPGGKHAQTSEEFLRRKEE